MNEPTSSPAENPLAALSGSLLSDPALLSKISQLMGAVTSSAPADAAPASDALTAPTIASPAADPLADGLKAVLSDPAAMEKLPAVMAAIKPLMGSVQPPKTSAPSPTSPEACRDHLLLALKPFLSPERRAAIDNILRISKLGSVFKEIR